MTLALRLVAKEMRALSLVFFSCLAAMIAAGVFPRWRAFVIPAYFLGAAAIGAQSIGHEYSHRTLALLLSQPARRSRLLLVKLGVLAAMLMAISAVWWSNWAGDSHVPESQQLAFGLLPILCGLSVAPWLTMVCRSPMAGTVFTIALPGAVLAASNLVYDVMYRTAPPADFETAVIWRGTLGLCAVGAVMSWRLFMRLEAIEGRGQDIHLPQWMRWRTSGNIAASAPTKRHPVWLLVKKEIRLQQLALAVAGLYVLGWLTLVLLRPRVNDSNETFNVITVFYGGLISMLIGSLASAEERQLGTLEWQVLLPVATWKQWAVKAGAALSLALLLALGLPALLASSSPTLDLERFFQPRFALIVPMLTIGSLYVSSLSTSGLRALLVSLPAILGAAFFLEFLVFTPGRAVFMTVFRMFRGTARVAGLVNPRLESALTLLLVAGFLVIVLRFALTNHRSADRAASRVWTQVIWMAFCLTIGVTLLAGTAAFVRGVVFWW